MNTDLFSAHQSDTSTSLRWDPQSTRLLVIDMVNDFCSPDGAMPLPDSGSLVRPVADLVTQVRSAGAGVIWVRDEHEPGDREFRKRSTHCLQGTWGAQIIPDLKVEDSDVVRTKLAFSAFYGTDLDETLRAGGVRTLLLCGVVTNICVRSTAHDAFFNGYDVIVASDACMGTSPREHASTLYDLDTHFGDVRTSAEVMQARNAS